jgi:diguanylate cyclase (GGDEF)-like protein
VDADELVARVRTHLRHSLRSQELLKRSQVDALTGVLNRGALDDELDRELQRMARTGQPLSVLMLDLDDFKSVNDRYGHAAGDDALRRCAQKLVSSLRATDRVGRFGGDEFLAILPDTGRDDAQALAERIAFAWRKHPPIPRGTSDPVLASIGTATAEKPMSKEALVEVADKRMYDNKRNRKRTRVER